MEKNLEKEILKDFDDALGSPRKKQKIRITTMVDGDILDKLKDLSKEAGIGYQTYLNDLLRHILFEKGHKEELLSRIESLEKNFHDLHKKLG